MGLWSHAPRYLFARHLDPLLPQFGLHPIPGQPPSVQIRPGCENLFLRKQLALYQERGERFIPDYVDLLASTGEGSPAELAARFGIDIQKKDFWAASLGVIKQRIDRYCAL